jgi:hypothetical protein
MSPTKPIAVCGNTAITFRTLSEWISGLFGTGIVARQSAARRTPSNREHPATILILFSYEANNKLSGGV